MKNVVVVGGGPSGLLAALLAAKRGKSVTVIEDEPECGGLLRSIVNKDGVSFDHGSHAVRQTGVAEIDDLLFGDLDRDPEAWQRMPFLRNGTFFQGKLYNRSGWVNLNSLPRPTYEKALVELLHLDPVAGETCATGEDYLLKTFGPTLVESLFRPAMRKFLGSELNELSPNAHRYFDLSRVIALTPEMSRQIKKSPAFDGRLAFHSSYEGQSGLMNYYPTTGGIGRWIPVLMKKLEAAGVRVLTSRRMERLELDGKRIKSIALSDGTSLPCDLLVWSVAPYPLLKAAGLTFNGSKLKSRNTALHFLVFDAPLKMECAAFTCFDPEYKSCRVTFYPNYRSNPKDKLIYAACVEVIGEHADASDEARRGIVDELKRMGLLDPSAKCLFEESRSAKGGFPVHTPQFVQQAEALGAVLSGAIDNLAAVGKGTGRTFFLSETLIDTHKTLTKVLA